MKNILKTAFIALLALTACDDIDEADRFEGPVEFTPKKNVLIEDFTGQRCLNCPLAAEAVSKMRQTYGEEHVIAVAIHGGSLSLPDTSPVGLANATGESYNAFWGVNSWPKGLVDRGAGWSNPSSALLEYTSWSAAAVKRLQVEPAVQMALHNTYDAETDRLSIDVDLTALADVDGMVQVWLTENQITAPQIMPNGTMNTSYEHSHVFRAAVNGEWGEAVQLAEGEDAVKSYTFDLSAHASWTPDHMAVVAFVYSQSEGVMQVIDSPVVATAAE